jgi:predicted transglutaminase-like cysteine proteinase
MQTDSSAIKRICHAAAAMLLLGLTAQTDNREPFGLSTIVAPEGPLSLTWRDLQSQMKAEQPIIAQCRAKPQSCSSVAALEFIAIVDQGAPYQGLKRIGHINRAVNLAIRAVGRTRTDNSPDKWTSPLATLAAGVGDCKQYAALKYAALHDAGLAMDDLRLVILKTKFSPETHAVVAVRNEGHWLILDNLSLALVQSRKLLDKYIPLYMLDHRGVRQFDLAARLAQKEVLEAGCALNG